MHACRMRLPYGIANFADLLVFVTTEACHLRELGGEVIEIGRSTS